MTGYTVFTMRPSDLHEDMCVVAERHVSTLDDARAECVSIIERRGYYSADSADAMPEKGGTIGPLFDGAVIEVQVDGPKTYDPSPTQLDVVCNADASVTITVDPATGATLAGRDGFRDLSTVQKLLETRIADSWYEAECPRTRTS